MSTNFEPTAEQVLARDAYKTGANLIIEAGAGSGKTATLVLLAESSPGVAGQYIAFNRAISNEAGGRMPGHVKASTAHSLAMRAVGYRYKERLFNTRRMLSSELANRMKIEPQTYRVAENQRVLSASFLAGLVMRSINKFCQSADREPGRKHIEYVEGIDEPTKEGARTYANNRKVQAYLEPFLALVWEDLQRDDKQKGQFPFSHAHYLKMWELAGPRIAAQVIYFDECQDVSPVLASIVRQQQDWAQLVYVGDANQAIYGFTGAIDALSALKAEGTRTTTLSQSFRFGPAIAEVANRVLAELPTDMQLTGTESIASVVGPVAEPDAVLCRTNAMAVTVLLNEGSRGRRGHLVGGGTEVLSFAKGALELQTWGRTEHQDLSCFSSWQEVREYVMLDPQGDELKLMVNLVEQFGPQTIIDALARMPREEDADVVISTAHKAKGRQWNTVQLAGDFPDDLSTTGVDELRLLYVAVTRARLELDASNVPWVVGAVEEQEEQAEAAPEAAPALS